MQPLEKRLLLINPWIFDFAAFDLWSKPLGLLYIASFLRSQGFKISYIDCLDKYHSVPSPKIKKYGTGNFSREVIEKPSILNGIQRKFARYGISESVFREQLKQYSNPDAILITSIMTYWYLGPKRVIEIVREMYPKVPVILGGIYATVMPEHAKRILKPDYLITGPGEKKVLSLLCDIFNFPEDMFQVPHQIDDYPYPAFDLINNPDYLLILTARGCPYNCSFCAQKQISMPFTQRNPQKVVEEIIYQYKKFHIRDWAFYDDALFINSEEHIKIILNEIIKSNLPLRFHSPNGLFVQYIDKELAELMYRSNFKTIRLSFETANENRRKDMHNKISNEGMVKAVNNLVKAGYKRSEIESYIIMGLPQQNLEEIVQSIFFVNNLGVQIRMASFSPIPGTQDFDRAVETGLIEANIDPLLTNKSIFPLKNEKINYDTYRKIRIFSQILNEAAKKKLAIFSDKPIAESIKTVLGEIQ
jgi:radical SAM superfamily enzyme YgiQ (UPF0313 family)